MSLSKGRAAKYANYPSALLRAVGLDLTAILRRCVEAVCGINPGPYKVWTKRDLKLTLRKALQYAKYGSCDKETSLPPEVSWISLNVKETGCFPKVGLN